MTKDCPNCQKSLVISKSRDLFYCVNCNYYFGENVDQDNDNWRGRPDVSTLKRPSVPAADAILGYEFPVLDKGFVRLIDYMGDDSAIVQAARVSYGIGTKTIREDKGLINFLLRNEHTSPFEMVEFKFHCKMPIFVARQWVRHRTASINEYSGRYSVMPNEFYIPADDVICYQNKINKQGRTGTVESDVAERFTEKLALGQGISARDYEIFLDMGIAKELARINLPLTQYTEWYWKINLKNILHFLKLRLDSHAQHEIKVYAEVMADMIKLIVPMTFESFDNWILRGRRFSGDQLLDIRRLISQLDESIGNNDTFIAEKELLDKVWKMIV